MAGPYDIHICWKYTFKREDKCLSGLLSILQISHESFAILHNCRKERVLNFSQSIMSFHVNKDTNKQTLSHTSLLVSEWIWYWTADISCHRLCCLESTHSGWVQIELMHGHWSFISKRMRHAGRGWTIWYIRGINNASRSNMLSAANPPTRTYTTNMRLQPPPHLVLQKWLE